MDQITISAKNLGALALNSFCPRCFWIKMRCENKLPYQIFPGIFSSIDSYTKKVTNLHHEKLSIVPKWLSGFGELDRPVKVPHFSKYFIIDPTTNVRLRGGPDEVIQRKDGSFVILDYKTAKYTGTQDDLLPMYEVQLNAYAYIGDRTEFKPVSALGLIYYEPITDLTLDRIEEVLIDSGFNMGFRSNVHPIKLEPETIIPPLLKLVRDISESAKAPDRLSRCKDCAALDHLIEFATN